MGWRTYVVALSLYMEINSDASFADHNIVTLWDQ